MSVLLLFISSLFLSFLLTSSHKKEAILYTCDLQCFIIHMILIYWETTSVREWICVHFSGISVQKRLPKLPFCHPFSAVLHSLRDDYIYFVCVYLIRSHNFHTQSMTKKRNWKEKFSHNRIVLSSLHCRKRHKMEVSVWVYVRQKTEIIELTEIRSIKYMPLSLYSYPNLFKLWTIEIFLPFVRIKHKTFWYI